MNRERQKTRAAPAIERAAVEPELRDRNSARSACVMLGGTRPQNELSKNRRHCSPESNATGTAWAERFCSRVETIDDR